MAIFPTPPNTMMVMYRTRSVVYDAWSNLLFCLIFTIRDITVSRLMRRLLFEDKSNLRRTEIIGIYLYSNFGGNISFP